MRKYIIFLKRLFGLKYSGSDIDYNSIRYLRQCKIFKIVRLEGKFIEVVTISGHRLFSRALSNGDIEILKQVWVDYEYKPLIDLYKDNISSRNEIKIIDAGANVGYVSSYFLSFFSNCKIACIEPDLNNLSILKKNLASYISNKKIIIYRNGLMDTDNINLSTSRDFRDGKDYSICVSICEEDTLLKSISINTIMKENMWDEVDVLKIDIEGAERFIFRDEVDLTFMNFVKVISIEIHDEYDIREFIYEKLHYFGFIIFNCRETTLGINQRYIHNKKLLV